MPGSFTIDSDETIRTLRTVFLGNRLITLDSYSTEDSSYFLLKTRTECHRDGDSNLNKMPKSVSRLVCSGSPVALINAGTSGALSPGHAAVALSLLYPETLRVVSRIGTVYSEP